MRGASCLQFRLPCRPTGRDEATIRQRLFSLSGFSHLGLWLSTERQHTDGAFEEERILTHEIIRLMSVDEFFTFAIHPEADGANDISER